MRERLTLRSVQARGHSGLAKVMTIVALLLMAATGAWAQPWTSGDCTVTLTDDGVLIVSGTGAMADYTKVTEQPWASSRSSITSIVVGEGVTHIGNFALAGCTKATSVSLPSSLTSIGTSAFRACNNAGFTSIAIPANVETIGDNAFHTCNKLTQVNIPDKVTSIGQNAFYGCTAVTSITVGKSVTSIGEMAFRNCSAMTTLAVKAPACALGTNALDACSSLTTIYVTTDKADYYKTADGWSAYAAKIQAGYDISLKEGTEDAYKWAIMPGLAAEGDQVTVKYNGRLKVKNVTATTDAAPPAPVEGKFTINADGDQVNFAKGNLQATTTDLGANWTWGFAEHQYDYIGNAVANTTINADGTTTENGTVDLFGWVGTSGNLTGVAEYGISSSKADADYGNLTTDQLKHDWGELIGDGKTWRVLTAAEWNYIINTRKDQLGSDVDRYAKATVNGVPGLILFPDEYEHVVTRPTNINVSTSAAKFGDNQYDLAAWTLMENAGCIFLPASGNRTGKEVNIFASYEKGNYWSSTPCKNKSNYACQLRFTSNGVDSPISDADASGRYYGNYVRLVKSATAQTAWDGDLSKLTAESTEKYATATDGMTITGTLAANVKVSIADGATVTLDNAVINGMNNDNYKWAGITCLGDATIILKDNTENTVKGFDAYYPGIQPAVGHKLIIKGGDQGTGKLTARSNGWAAGIGSGYGSGRPCGSIEIQGGNITATGGSRAAGIGSAYGGTCGDITIANTVTKVTATKGTNAPYSIGASDNGGTCGTVTIGGTKYWENNAPLNNGDTYLGQATIIYPEP